MKGILESVKAAMDHQPVLATCLILFFTVAGIFFGLLMAANLGLKYQKW